MFKQLVQRFVQYTYSPRLRPVYPPFRKNTSLAQAYSFGQAMYVLLLVFRHSFAVGLLVPEYKPMALSGPFVRFKGILRRFSGTRRVADMPSVPDQPARVKIVFF